MLQAICFVFLINLGVRIRADVYTSVADLEYSLEAQRRVKDYLEFYIERHEKRFAILQSYLDIFNREHEKAIKDITNYLGNPVNVFTLFKRLTVDVHYIKYSIKDETDYIESITNNYHKYTCPTMADLRGAAEGLIRLQDVYKLEVKDFSEGKLNGSAYSSPMTACDCFELGRALYAETDFGNGLKWILEALRKYNEEIIHYSLSAVDIIEHISYGYSKLGELRSSLQWIQKILDQDPHNSRAREIAQICRISMRDERYVIMANRAKDEEKHRKKLKAMKEWTYYSLCRGEMDMPMQISSRLTCRYLTENHPFLKLAPFKMELLYSDPDIVLFHDVLSDSEIETVKKLAKCKLSRSGVRDSKTGGGRMTPHRISKTAWIPDTDSETVARITRRVTHMTGLSLTSAEDLQVANYGIGGYYEIHCDFITNVTSKFKGNRIATVLFYMSDVTQGGATVFPKLGLSVYPVKGAAVFWFNLHTSGDTNNATLHAACPVLQGSKWISTKWIHEHGQEFIKPCSLENYKEGHLHKYSLRKTPF